MCAQLAEYYQSQDDTSSAAAQYKQALSLLDAIQEDAKASYYKDYKEFFEARLAVE